MRLWSIHPSYLDSKGLVALWREGLLAFAVLQGRTRGYRSHPQLARFSSCRSPVSAIRVYLWHVWNEADARGYRFDLAKVGRPGSRAKLTVTRGQLRYELAHLKRKLRDRDRPGYARLLAVTTPRPHPMFVAVAGGVEPWERSSLSRERRKDAGVSR